jgi:hypothetical protein
MICAYPPCARELPKVIGRGLPRKYCSRVHKQADYRRVEAEKPKPPGQLSIAEKITKLGREALRPSPCRCPVPLPRIEGPLTVCRLCSRTVAA